MPRFVLLFHECPSGFPRPSHCDLMLESGDSLRTWSLVELPNSWATLAASRSGVGSHVPAIAVTNRVPAEQLADHRLDYLDYEGPVSGDRGRVLRLDAGTFDTRLESPTCWEVVVHGTTLRGRIALELESADERRWRLSYQSGTEE